MKYNARFISAATGAVRNVSFDVDPAENDPEEVATYLLLDEENDEYLDDVTEEETGVQNEE